MGTAVSSQREDQQHRSVGYCLPAVHPNAIQDTEYTQLLTQCAEYIIPVPSQADSDTIARQKPHEAVYLSQTPLYEFVCMFPKAIRNTNPNIEYRRVMEQVVGLHKIMPVLPSGPGLAMTDVVGEKVGYGAKCYCTAYSTTPGVPARSSLGLE